MESPTPRELIRLLDARLPVQFPRGCRLSIGHGPELGAIHSYTGSDGDDQRGGVLL
jgi:hypothetical protein